MKKFYVCMLAFLFLGSYGYAQNCSSMGIQWEADIASTCDSATMTMIHDQIGRPYLYIANKKAGLRVYHITNISNPVLVSSIPTSQYGNLDVMSVTQRGVYLYLALGNHFTNPQQGGIAIVDVSSPGTPLLTDYEIVPGSSSGAGIVKVEGDYAYVAAMQSGLAIYDVGNPSNMGFVSQYAPDINYPVPNPNPSLYNARGMEVKNSIVYLCYGGGGFRIINCTDKTSPVQTGQYANPATYTPWNRPRAYNNIVLDDSLVYIAVDYCGMEVLNISDTSNITLTGWWNPGNCPNNNWFNTPTHTNEMHYDANCKKMFLSTGKSDMIVVDVSNPALPDSCNYYGGVANGIGTWGVSVYQDHIFLSYVCAVVPFSSNWSGIKILSYNTCMVTSVEEFAGENDLSLYPNPASDNIEIDIPFQYASLDILNSMGQRVKHIDRLAQGLTRIATHRLPQGLYFLSLQEKGKRVIRRFMIER